MASFLLETSDNSVRGGRTHVVKLIGPNLFPWDDGAWVRWPVGRKQAHRTLETPDARANLLAGMRIPESPHLLRTFLGVLPSDGKRVRGARDFLDAALNDVLGRDANGWNRCAWEFFVLSKAELGRANLRHPNNG